MTNDDHGLVHRPGQVEAASWSQAAHETTRAYQAAVRLEQAQSLATRAADTITAVSHHITNTGPHHPALEAELRAIEVTVARACADLLHLYLRGQ